MLDAIGWSSSGNAAGQWMTMSLEGTTQRVGGIVMQNSGTWAGEWVTKVTVAYRVN